MIVKCERCQTRFKIPDEKVTDKGVKVRCTKCQNTFRVSREPDTAKMGAPPAPPPTAQVDSSGQPSVAPDPWAVEVTTPGYFAKGVEATKGSSAARPASAPWNRVDGDIGSEASVFDEPTRVGPMSPPRAARPPTPSFEPPKPGGPRGAAPGAVALPGGAGARRAPRSPGALAAPGAGSQTSAPRGPERAPAAGASVASPRATLPAPVTMFGSPKKGGAPPSVAAREAEPIAGGGPPPAPGAAGFGAAPVAGARSNARRAATLEPSAGAAPPLELGGEDPFADLLDGQGPAQTLPPAGAFDLLPSSRAAAPAAPVGAFDVLPPPKVSPAKALRRAAAPPISAPSGAVAMGPVRPASRGVVAPSSPPPFSGEDSFGSIDDATGPSTVRASPGALAVPAGEDPFGSIDLNEAPVASVPFAPSASAQEDPFGSIDLNEAPVASVPFAPSASAQEDPFGSIDLNEAPVASVPFAPSASAQEEDPFASIDLGGPGAEPPAPVTLAPAASPLSAPALVSAPQRMAPAAAPQALAPSADDLFDFGVDADSLGEHAGMQPTDTGRAALLGTRPQADDGLEGFAASLESAGASLLGDVPPMDAAQDFSVKLGRVGAPTKGSVEVLDVGALPETPVVTVTRPTARPEDVGIPQSRPLSRARKVTGLIANLVVAAVLVVGFAAVGRVYLREGRVDLSVLSPEHLRTLVIPAPQPLVAVDVSNALYETRAGRPLFFVRGEAENRTGSATRIRVRAALYDGTQRVRSAEVLAGAVPTPEQLYAVGDSQSATALSQRLDAAATSVAPGAKVPFLVMFHEYPADLGSFRLEVTLEPVASATAEATGRTE